jgi:hypothetical protein
MKHVGSEPVDNIIDTIVASNHKTVLVTRCHVQKNVICPSAWIGVVSFKIAFLKGQNKLSVQLCYTLDTFSLYLNAHFILHTSTYWQVKPG